MKAPTTCATRRPRRQPDRGQILVIFAGGLIAFMALASIVVDVAWYWSSNIRIQRAADAAALAGAVDLPGNVAQAYMDARAEATKNGYTTGGGVTVTPVQDATNPRQLNVTISAGVGTFFMHVLGINSIPARQTAKAEFVLPVPMGSPQNYYGVGEFVKDVTTTKTTPVYGDTGLDSGGNGSPNSWLNPGRADGTANSSAATNDTNATSGIWQAFGLQSGGGAIPTSAVIDGLEVETRSKVSTLSGSCTLQIDASWDGGTTWSTVVNTPTLATVYRTDTVGAPATTATWGGHSWVRGDFSDANFRARVTYNKASCGTASLDTLKVRVSYHTTTTTTTTTPTVTPVNAPTGGALAPQKFWGAVITLGGQRGNGDEFSPANDGGSGNADFNANGYDYTVEVGAGGQVQLYDPTFCAVDPYKGTGDHWIGTSGAPVSTVYTLFNTNGTPYTIADDKQVATSGALFNGKNQSDQSGDFGTPPTAQGETDCASDPYHNAWWQMASGLASGTYRLNVTTNVAGNSGTNAENMWSIWVSGGAKPRVYGKGSMAAYNNLQAGAQVFYLAQIDAAQAGKTMEILLFDPGDVNGDATLKILSPDGNAYNYTKFSYASDGNCISGRSDVCNATGRTSIQTATGGKSSFNNTLITITIPLDRLYGSVGLTPSGETEAGWWKIEYTIAGASADDTTTWRVNLRGNPVHLKLP